MSRSPRRHQPRIVVDARQGSGRDRVVSAVLEALRVGALVDGDALPASRALAAEQQIPRSAVIAAYDSLTGSGLLNARQGSGTVVAQGAAALVIQGARPDVAGDSVDRPLRPLARASRRTPNPVLDLIPGHPDIALLHQGDWRRAWRRAAQQPADDHEALGDLRVALAAHLRRFRGVVVPADALLLSPGVNHVLSTVARRAGLVGRTVAVEDPGYPSAREALSACGCRVLPVPVDEQGLAVDDLTDDVAAVYVTPAHQYPMGAVMSLQRRAALLDWARQTGGLILEDDYDAEFRYDHAPIPALHTLDGAADHVVHIGTASKILTPEFRIAWAALPTRLRVDPTAERELVNGVAARALTHLLQDDAVARHQARALRVYSARRARLTAALAERAPGLSVLGAAAGLHLAMLLPAGEVESTVVKRLSGNGFAVAGLATYALLPAPPGLVIGYARLPETRAGDLADALVDALRRGDAR